MDDSYITARAILLLFLIAIIATVILYAISKALSYFGSIIQCRRYKIKKASNGSAVWFVKRVLKVSSKKCKEGQKTEGETNKHKSFKCVVNLFKTSEDIWIPLNDVDSCTVENAWLNRDHNITIMNGHFKVNNEFAKLIPCHWEKEKAEWFLARGDYIYEVPFSPPALYFMNIKPDNEMTSFYQPTSHSPELSFVKDIYDCKQFASPDTSSSVPHLIFVIHGIGHHQSEKGVVENSNRLVTSLAQCIREGFIRYLKKFYPTVTTPVVIPIAWRYNLSLEDEKITCSQSLQFKHAKKLGITSNKPLYYFSEYENEMKTSLINQLNAKYQAFKSNKPKVSLLAHSLGSVMAYDILNDEYQLEEKRLEFEVENLFLIGSPLARFLITKRRDSNFKENPLVINGRIFNIVNPDDPVTHRLETLFDPNYKYVEPLALEEQTVSTLQMSTDDLESFVQFHETLTKERELARRHNYLFEVDYSKEDDIVDEEKEDLPEEIQDAFSEVNVVDTNILELKERIPVRLDYNPFYTPYRSPKFIVYNTFFYTWMRKVATSHSSYWNNSGTIALMTNIIYGYDSTYVGNTTSDDRRIIGKSIKIITTIILIICRFWCTVSLLFHTEPLMLKMFIALCNYSKIDVGDKCENASEMHKFYTNISLLLLWIIIVLSLYFDKKLRQISLPKSIDLFLFGVSILILTSISLLNGVTSMLLQIIHNYLLIILSVVSPNVHKLVGFAWNILNLLGYSIPKFFIYCLFFVPALLCSLYSYVFDNLDFQLIFWRSYVFTLFFCNILRYVLILSSRVVPRDQLEHVSSPDEKCYRANIVYKTETKEFGSVTKKRLTGETDTSDIGENKQLKFQAEKNFSHWWSKMEEFDKLCFQICMLATFCCLLNNILPFQYWFWIGGLIILYYLYQFDWSKI